jgi:hypothetical protein
VRKCASRFESDQRIAPFLPLSQCDEGLKDSSITLLLLHDGYVIAEVGFQGAAQNPNGSGFRFSNAALEFSINCETETYDSFQNISSCAERRQRFA